MKLEEIYKTIAAKLSAENSVASQISGLNKRREQLREEISSAYVELEKYHSDRIREYQDGK